MVAAYQFELLIHSAKKAQICAENKMVISETDFRFKANG